MDGKKSMRLIKMEINWLIFERLGDWGIRTKIINEILQIRRSRIQFHCHKIARLFARFFSWKTPWKYSHFVSCSRFSCPMLYFSRILPIYSILSDFDKIYYKMTIDSRGNI